ncbi:MAG: CPBP family intramembrane glutamic endopeptidase, partial [Candidatus Babeliales bacterium]
VHLDITMNRNEALRQAAMLAKKFNWGPENYKQATVFDNDDEAQNFIELEGGGKKAFAHILEEKYFAPYTWHVRHFAQSNPNETLILFTPEGNPYGFREKIAEDTPGKALFQEEARALAVNAATKDWHTDFANYTLVESSQEAKPNGRIDHTFSYDNKNKKVGNAPYRLKLVVSGDKLTEYSLSLKVPEAFKRRYEEMRSANETLARSAGILAIILYIFGGCVFGLFFLLRRRFLQWRTALAWGTLISLLQSLNYINGLPLYWMYYDTQMTTATFLSSFLLQVGMQFFGFMGAYTLIFMAAESLGRKAFPEHLQLWQLWKKDAASSWQVLGRTVGAYLLIGFDLAFVTAFYYCSSRYFGWWSPSETLFNPNILSYYAPWLSSVAQSLQAGFLEECWFRAIPLSCAILIGQKWGRKNLWLIAGFIVQALIFSAAHANYPAQPFYARLVELIIPSCIFGSIYLYFGLLPGILSHFFYDLFLYALPLFIATAPGIWLDKLFVILVSLIPLFIVLNARLCTGRWTEIPKRFFNNHWQPEKASAFIPKHQAPLAIHFPSFAKKIIMASGFLGLFLWIFFTPFKQDGPTVKASRTEALQKAEASLHNKNIDLSVWHILVTTENSTLQDVDRFVWQTNGKKIYHNLIGTYLTPAEWKIRFAQFDRGDITARAEEYALLIDEHGNTRIQHQLPESKPGKTSSEQEARTLAQQFIKNTYNLDTNVLKEISAVATKQPERLDWTFTFQDITSPLKQGEARITIKIADNEVTDYNRFVFVPEQWTRSYQQHKAILDIITMICSLALLLFLTIGAVQGILMWAHHQFAVQFFVIFFILFFGKSIIQIINFWPTFAATFKTSEPYWHQALSLVSGLLMRIFFKAGAYGLIAGFTAQATFNYHAALKTKNRILLGTCLGVFFIGCISFFNVMSPSLKPLWAEYIHMPAFMPSVSIALTMLTTFIYEALLLYMIFWILDTLTQGWKKHILVTLFISIVTGLAYYGTPGVEHISSWLGFGCAVGLLFCALYGIGIRFSNSIIPLIACTKIVVESIQQGVFHPYHGTLLGYFIGTVTIICFALWWSEKLEKNNHQIY